MTATIAPFAPSARPSTPRVLGALGILGSPVFLAQWLAAPSSLKVPDTTAAALLGIVYLMGWACSAVALRRLRATGRGRGGAVILAVQLVGLSLAAGQQIQDALHAHPLGDVVYGVCDAAWPLSHLFMLVVGVAVLRARASGPGGGAGRRSPAGSRCRPRSSRWPWAGRARCSPRSRSSPRPRSARSAPRW
ncbi:hypothetical protein J421_6251 (plasmid) [Gemmatirosa kalamazoonensis]|uniref:Uncharacterized protein n=1 Tax=Gemmatirosa kalamazoonensis TaxID=861299 RepID=W0RSX9_9BACT|nr:hypothetical protein [Gemmatirosa kalamazoonensis]AHG93786.1 hypothetical protein J421_6251 [Gemmatirosa kalamazoonensis]